MEPPSDMQSPVRVDDSGRAYVLLSKECYAREAIVAAAYDVSNSHTVTVDVADDQHWAVWFGSVADACAENFQQAVDEFMRALADHQVRLDIEARTGPIREMIVAHAFAPLEAEKKRHPTSCSQRCSR